MGDFFGNLWQGLIGNGNQGGGDDGQGGSVGGGIGNFLNGFATGFGGGAGTTPIGFLGGGVQGAPGGAIQSAFQNVIPPGGFNPQGANVASSPFEPDNQRWTSNGSQSLWGTPIPPQQGIM